MERRSAIGGGLAGVGMSLLACIFYDAQPGGVSVAERIESELRIREIETKLETCRENIDWLFEET